MVKIQGDSQGKVYITASNKVLLAGGPVSKYGLTIDNILGDVDANGVLQAPTDMNGITFTGIKDVPASMLAYAFYYNQNVKGTISFPDLTTLSGNYACYNMFNNCNGLTSISLPELTTISGNYACYNMFYTCSNLDTVSLPKLTTISGERACYFTFCQTKISSISFPYLTTVSGSYACDGMFNNCQNITDIYFNALTTVSFGSNVNQFDSMLGGTGTNVTHTLHFPSNLETTIQGLSGYPLFGGTSGYVTLAYDLPATE